MLITAAHIKGDQIHNNVFTASPIKTIPSIFVTFSKVKQLHEAS